MAELTQEVAEAAQRFLVCDVATLTRRGTPVTWPMTPYAGAAGDTVDVSTGVTYPAKADRARRDPKVALLFSDPFGSGLTDPRVVLVQGLASVRDADIQANTDRYLRESLTKLRGAWRGTPSMLIRAQAWYWARIYIEVTPLVVRSWKRGDLESEPNVWRAPAGTISPPSDPPPVGGGPGPWQRPAGPWKERALGALARLGSPVLTVVDTEGFPLACPTSGARLLPDGFALDLPGSLKAWAGPACLSFSVVHGADFRGQENAAFTGSVDPDGRFVVDRVLSDFSLPGSGMGRLRSFFGARARLKSRLVTECGRRGQPVPTVRLPGR